MNGVLKEKIKLLNSMKTKRSDLIHAKHFDSYKYTNDDKEFLNEYNSLTNEIDELSQTPAQKEENRKLYELFEKVEKL